MEVLALLRGLHVAAILSVLGTTAFLAWILPAAVDGRPARPVLIRLWRISGWLAVASGVAWFIAQADEIAGAPDVASLAAALPIVADQTRYGQAMLLRGLLLLGAVLLAGPSRRRPYLGLLATGVALGLQGAFGHAGAAAGNMLLASEWLHLLAAGVWLGGLLPLWLTFARLPAANAAAVCERFTPVGLACVLVLAGTGLVQGLALIGDLPALLGTAYGRIALIKIGLFLLALALAAANRLWLTDRLASHFPNARGRIRLSVLAETATGLLIVFAAAFLASTPPGIHDESVWPLSWQFSLATVREDSGFRTEVIISGLLIGLTAVMLIASLLRRRFRVVATGLLAGIIAWRAPSFVLLTATAYPTSFQTSPTGFSVTSILRGQALYQTHCAGCHGAKGRGDGPLAAGMRIRPADLTAQHLWDHSDGEMFWWLTRGMDAPDGQPCDARIPFSAAGRSLGVDRLCSSTQRRCRAGSGHAGGCVSARAGPANPLRHPGGNTHERPARRAGAVGGGNRGNDRRAGQRHTGDTSGPARRLEAGAPIRMRRRHPGRAAGFRNFGQSATGGAARLRVLGGRQRMAGRVVQSQPGSNRTRHRPATGSTREVPMSTTIKPPPPSGPNPPNRTVYGVIGVLLAVLLIGAGSFLWLSTGPNNPGGIGGPFTLEDGNGKTVTDRDFRGKYMLVYFGYTFCPDVCPTTLNAVAEAMDKLGPAASRVRPVFITVDPKRDTAAVVKQYAAAFGPSITGLTGTPAEIAQVAKAYRVYYAEHRTGTGPNDYSMDHSSILYLIGPDGAFIAPVRADQSGDEIAVNLKKLMS